MKQRFIRLAGIISLVLITAVATAGTWSDNQFIYKPDLGARGPSEKANFETGLVRVDAHLGKYKTLGDPNYTTLAQALTTIGSTQVTLTIPAGTVAVTGNTTIPANIALVVQKGGKFEVAGGVTLTINGAVEAGPYQIFSGTGAVIFGGVSAIYDVWLASPPSTPEGAVAAPVGARFTKTTGSAPLVYVKESGAGNTGWVAASTLTHTHTSSQVGLGNVSNDAQLKRAAGDFGSFAEKTAPAGADLVLIEDSANSFNKKKVQIANLPGGGGSSTFTGLTDAPDSYSGQAGKALRVNTGETALEFYTPSSASGPKPYHVLGETGYATLAEAIATIGSTETTLVLPAEAGAVAVTSNCTIGRNIRLKIENGAYVNISDGVTLSIEGPLEAGAYKIFQWTGTGKPSLTKSPTVDCPLEWWGAKTGAANDCAAAFNKVDDCLASHQNVRLGPGVYRIASPVVWIGNTEGSGRNGFGLYGTSEKTVILINTPGNIGFTIGESGTNSYYWRVREIFFAGAANSCTTAFKAIRAIYSHIGRLTFLVGSTDYAMVIQGCENTTWKLNFGMGGQVMSEYGISYGQMANNLKIQADTGLWVNNTWNDLEVLMSGTLMGAYGINAEGVYDNWRIRGDIENVTTAIRLKDCYGFNVEALHVENCDNGIQLEGCRNINLSNVKPKNPNEHYSYIKNSSGIAMTGCMFSHLTIYPGCSGIVMTNCQMSMAHGLVDLSGCLEMYGTTTFYNAALNTQYALHGQNGLNVIANTYMNRWQTDRPDGWGVHANATWTKTGVGETDTIRHLTNYCAKLVSTGTAYINYTFTAEERAMVLGSYITGSAWAMQPSGQTFSSNGVILGVTASVPAWSASTAYKVGEAVTGSGVNGRLFVCVQAGTSGASAPSWTDVIGVEYTDGTVKWVCIYCSGSSYIAWPMGTSQSNGTWYKLSAGCYIPSNATQVYLQINSFAQTAGSGTCYIAEPAVHIGTRPSRGVQQGKDEHESQVKIGGNRMTWGPVIPTNASSPLYAQWAQQGDVHWSTAAAAGGSPGWVCTTSGLNNAGAVWKAMANLGS